MAAKKIAVDLFYDVISPYSWLSFELLCRYRNQWESMSLKFKPFLLGSVMKESGSSPSFSVENKAKYVNKDIKRINHYYGIPIAFPKNYIEVAIEKTTLKAQRFITAIDILTDGQYTEEISRQLWKRIFTTHKDVTIAESFREAGRDAKISPDIVEKAIVAMEQTQTKEKLKSFTNEALSYGAFGAPTVIVHAPSGPELVFGSDRMEVIALLLGEKYIGPLNKYSKI